MNTEPKYYVYEHIRPDTGAVFYVGKGCGKRAINKASRGDWWKRIVAKSGGLEIRYPVKDVDEELALLAEMEYIDVLRRRGVKLINICDGGEGAPGWVPSEETRRKIGEANKRIPKLRGEQHPMYGKKHTPESLAKMRESQKAREWGEKHPMYGKTHSEETRQKISANRKGKMTGVNNPFYGKKHTPEALEKMRSVHIGRQQSPEEIEKRRETAIKNAPTSALSRPVFCITNGQWYYGLNAAASILGLHRQCIRMVCNGKLKQTGGFKFEWSKK